MSKLNVLIIFGGASPEHEVSVLSAKTIIDNIDRSKFEPFLCGISKNGEWYILDEALFLKICSMGFVDGTYGNKIFPSIIKNGIGFKGFNKNIKIDIAFPIIHGKTGEDGLIQGFLELCGLPYIGSGIRASAICMDKINCKNILEKNNIKVTPYIEILDGENTFSFDEIKERLGIPFFIKPSNSGSSLGVSKVRDFTEYNKAIEYAKRFDKRILIESAITGKEIECAILGSTDPIASVIGEIIPNSEFYSYEAKYINKNGANFLIPADVSKEISNKIREIAKYAHKIIGCRGLSRVDFFLSNNNEIFLNEINTLPGFTSISMYPVLFEHSGISVKELITTLIEESLYLLP